MKKLIILLMVGLAGLTVKAQQYHYVPFPDSNAVWSEVFWKSYFDPPPPWVYNQYALFNEDTVINGITYHKLFHSNACEITLENSECIGGIREDSLKRIWVNGNLFPFPDRHIRLLFDFSLYEGDTLWMDENFYNCTCNFLSIKNIDTISIHNSLRKVFYFNESDQIIWIEGIGNLQGLTWCTPSWPTNGVRNDLVCMHQNDTLLYYYSGTQNIPYDDCVPSFVIDGVSILANHDIKVYPNPTKTGIVYFENLDFENLELFDLNGNLMREETIRGLIVFELKIPGFPPGIYTYRLTTKGLVPTQGKLVVQ